MTDAHGVARDQLRAFIERIERLEEEKKTIADDIKDVYGEAKSMGYDTKIMKKVIALRKKDDQERMEEEVVLGTYLSALGMIQADFFEGTPAETDTSVGSGRGTAAPLRARSETISETPKQVYGDSGAEATALPSQSVNIPAGGDQGQEIDGSDDCCPTELHSPETATKSGADTDPGETAAEGISEAVTAGETATQFHAKASDDAYEAGRKALGRAEASAEAPDGAEVVSRGVGDRPPTATSEYGRDSLERQAPHPTTKPTAHVLRPHCLKPEKCSGHGSNHCHSCKCAMRELEAT